MKKYILIIICTLSIFTLPACLLTKNEQVEVASTAISMVAQIGMAYMEYQRLGGDSNAALSAFMPLLQTATDIANMNDEPASGIENININFNTAISSANQVLVTIK
jgi:hypothetical protein